MATVAYAADWNLPSVSRRRSSTETVYSIQDIETDIVRDTSDTEPPATDDEVEYEPISGSEQEVSIDENASASSEGDIINAEVIAAVPVSDDSDLQLADSEFTDTCDTSTQFRRHYFLKCAKCKDRNTNPIYRYCYNCFSMLKSCYPPRPRRNRKKSKNKSPERSTKLSDASPIGGLSQQTDLESGQFSQSGTSSQSGQSVSGQSGAYSQSGYSSINLLKRRADSVDDLVYKKSRYDSGTETDMDEPVQPLVKTVSDPVTQIEPINLDKKSIIANAMVDNMDTKDLCVICVSEPKSGVFVHSRIAHICCCYRCAVKVWSTVKRCPVCNCKVSKVLRAVVM